MKDLQTNINGAKRESKKGKGRFDLLPYHIIEKLAIHLENGAIEHGVNNWRKGLDIDGCYSSAIRHLLKASNSDFMEDMETIDYHLIACVFNLMVIIEDRENKKDS